MSLKMLLALVVLVTLTQATYDFGCKPFDPEPTYLKCGVRGNFEKDLPYDFNYTGPQLLSTVNECRNLCLRHESRASRLDGCTSFYYNAQTQICRLEHENSAGDYFKPDPSGPLVYSDAQCYNCTICPQPDGVNLLDNGDFELSSRFLAPWIGYAYSGHANPVIVSQGMPANNVLHCPKTTSPYHYCELKQLFNFCFGTYYLLSLDVKVFPAHNRFRPQISFGATTVEMPQTNGSWTVVKQFIQLTHRFDPNDSFNTLNVIGGQEYYLDNVSVTAIPADKFLTKPGAQSVFSNGGFDNGKLEPWIFHPRQGYHLGNSSHEIVSPGLGGTKHAFLFQTTTRAGFSISQTLRTTAGTRYLLSFDWQGPDYRNGCQVRFGNTYFLLKIRKNTTLHVKKAVIASANETRFHVKVSALRTGSTQTSISFDNFSLKELV